jgi:hypothetical protein
MTVDVERAGVVGGQAFAGIERFLWRWTTGMTGTGTLRGSGVGSGLRVGGSFVDAGGGAQRERENSTEAEKHRDSFLCRRPASAAIC